MPLLGLAPPRFALLGLSCLYAWAYLHRAERGEDLHFLCDEENGRRPPHLAHHHGIADATAEAAAASLVGREGSPDGRRGWRSGRPSPAYASGGFEALKETATRLKRCASFVGSSPHQGA